ncbi:complex I intermediate associated protein [Biomphalaria glabrata]|uniref:Complex I intermediate-associated protein 30, mitochondrial-like n=1 Tax=Biomphalaria glabrata TaxID=6526 RepID=A0A9W2ZYU0_BIOGL|nr:complex I intermediate-associated protein 30, mitochondrial-like [Biomphalaria glabrata]XP_055880048.1 complex I intermediate-associated protein 30, mitochondrial-like [Biomphalaria glabrata]XP_055880049.1 complex I intermediate-associated protein 30, mitochondrial-like [Biomphalaria glabrata]XP_055880050.1 complex I intermediate-associated protein 30, mitochondrial-like [Biomphalaria glabrata]XP_055880051.1 complex I intermediate-associated protein 30, mitochondrial-like [Biomphalaria glabr
MSALTSPRSLLKNVAENFNQISIFKRSSTRRSTVIVYQKTKSGRDEEPEKPPLRKAASAAFKSIIPETKKFITEQKDIWTRSPMIECEHGNYEVLCRFNKQSEVDKWIVSTDSDNKGGKSTAEFTFSKNKTGWFHGNICKEVPKDGLTKYAGWANITTKTPKKSFFRETNWDWSLFNCIVFKVRGDGRPYNIVLGCNFYYDVNWLNRWTFPLYTRGGPYWQISKLPFSRFYLSHHGRIQDIQEYPCLSLVNSLGITVMDSAEGPFSLEIESIALMYDVNLTEKHAYELFEDRNFQGNC